MLVRWLGALLKAAEYRALHVAVSARVHTYVAVQRHCENNFLDATPEFCIFRGHVFGVLVPPRFRSHLLS